MSGFGLCTWISSCGGLWEAVRGGYVEERERGVKLFLELEYLYSLPLHGSGSHDCKYDKGNERGRMDSFSRNLYF